VFWAGKEKKMEILKLLGPEALDYFIAFIASGLIAYFMTDMVKPLLYLLRKGQTEDPPWWTSACRALPLFFGLISGLIMLPWDQSWIGVVGGGFSVAIYHKFERKIKSAALTSSDIDAVATRIAARSEKVSLSNSTDESSKVD